MKKKIIGLLGVVGLMLSLAACNDTKAYGSQCAYIIGNGQGDNHQIKKILRPGDQVHKGDDIAQFVPCNARNYLITAQEKTGDRNTPAVGRTAASNTSPSLPVQSYLRSYFTLNQSEDALKAFQPFCEKYGCYTTDGDKVTGDANFSSPGWNGMLRENYSLVINKVFKDAIAQQGPDIWKTQDKWSDVAAYMSKNFAEEMRRATGSDKDFFCGSWSKNGERTESCTPVRFEIDDISPVDKAVEDVQQQTALAAQQQALNDAKSLSTAKRYGNLANYFNGLQDTIAACKEAGQSCTIVIGGSNITVTPNGAK